MKLELDVIGRLGKDVEIKTVNDSQVMKLNVAFTEKWMKNGEKQSKTTWVSCNWWFTKDKDLTNLAKYLKKGVLISVQGIPSVRAWDKDGSPQASLELRVFKLSLLTFPDTEPAKETPKTKTESPIPNGDDLPF